MKDRESGDHGEAGEGVDHGGDCKNKGFGFVSFQASKSFNMVVMFLCGRLQLQQSSVTFVGHCVSAGQ